MALDSKYDVFLGAAWLGTIEARDERHAAEVAARTFGSFLSDVLRVKPQSRSEEREKSHGV